MRTALAWGFHSRTQSLIDYIHCLTCIMPGHAYREARHPVKGTPCPYGQNRGRCLACISCVPS